MTERLKGVHTRYLLDGIELSVHLSGGGAAVTFMDGDPVETVVMNLRLLAERLELTTQVRAAQRGGGSDGM